jgi:hypothetical protein
MARCELKSCGAERPISEMRLMAVKGNKLRYRCRSHFELASLATEMVTCKRCKRKKTKPEVRAVMRSDGVARFYVCKLEATCARSC